MHITIDAVNKYRLKGYSYQKIAGFFGCSRQRIHQIYTSYKTNKPSPVTEVPKNWIPLKTCNTKGLGHLSGTTYLSEIVRRRDNWTCQICNKIWKEGKRRFDVHHLDQEYESKITYENYKKFDRMITLCHQCHLRLKHIRLKFKKII